MKSKKLLSLMLITMLIISNLSTVFAEEGDPNEPEDPPVQDPEPDQVEDAATVTQVNQISNQIQVVQNTLNQMQTNIESLTPGNGGLQTNFNGMNVSHLQYYYDHFAEFGLVWTFNKTTFWFVYLGDITNVELYPTYIYFQFTDSYYLSQGQPVHGNVTERSISLLYNSDDYSQATLLYRSDLNSYEVTPYKLTIINNGNGNITNSVNTEPYLSTQIYYDGQYIRLEYDNTDDDFTGWYSLSGQLLSLNPVYSFNITSDTTLVLNYEFESLDYTDQFNMLITILAGLLLVTISKGEIFNG